MWFVYTGINDWWKQTFPLLTVNNRRWLLGSDGGFCLLHLSAVQPHLTWTCTISEPAVSVSLSSEVCQFSYAWKSLFSWCLLYPLPPTIFQSPLPKSALNTEGMNLMDTSYLGLSIWKSLTLHIIWLCVSVFVPIYCRRKHVWWWMNKTSINKYNRLLLGVTLLV